MTARARLKRLEASARRRGLAGPGGCPACRGRVGRVTLVEARCLPDGAVVPDGPYPAPCSACGDIPEFLIEVVQPPEQAEEWPP